MLVQAARPMAAATAAPENLNCIPDPQIHCAPRLNRPGGGASSDAPMGIGVIPFGQ